MKEADLLTQKARNPVVLVHGIWNTAAIFTTLQAHLEREGWQVYAPSLTPNNGDAPLENLAEQVAKFINSALGSQQQFDLLILPPWSSDLSQQGIGQSQMLKVSAHNQMIYDAWGLEAIATCLSAYTQPLL